MDFTETKELRSAGEMDDETIAKKRLRRVSFAETTAVHVFDRDDDFDTPPDARPGSSDGSTPAPGGEAPGFRGDHSDSDDSKGSALEDDDEDNDEEEGEQMLFVRDMDSSPGSAVGSVTSNDDDNFFGPVSASFIRSGRLSESGMSEDNNHDITLDSTAFSLHFRNIAPSTDRSANSVGSIRTPATEETMPADPLGFKKPIPDTKISDASNTRSAGGSNCMSLIVENPHKQKYDYGKMSPTLEALIAEVDRSLKHDGSPSDGTRVGASGHPVEESGKVEKHTGNCVGSDYRVDDGYSMGIAANQIGEASPSHDLHRSPRIHDSTTNEETQGTVHPMVEVYFKDDRKATQSDIVGANAQIYDLLSPPYRKSQNNSISKSDNIHHKYIRGEADVSNDYSKILPESATLAPELVVIDKRRLLESECEIHTPKNVVQPFHTPLQGSVSSLHAKRQQLFLDHAVLSQSKLIQSPAKEQPPSLEMEFARHSDRISAVKNHISKFKIPEMPIVINSRPAFSGMDHMLLDDGNTRHMGVSMNNVEGNFINAVQNATGCEINALNYSGFKTPNNRMHSENNKVVGETVKLTDAISCLQFSKSEINVKQNQLAYHNPIEPGSTPNAHGSSQRQPMVELKKISQEGFFTPGAGGTIGSSSLLDKNRLQPSTPFTTTVPNNVRSLRSLKELANNDITSQNFQEEIVYSRDIHLGSQDMNIGIKKVLINAREKLSERERFGSSYEPGSRNAYKVGAIISKSKFYADTVQSSDKEGDNSTDNNIQPSFNLMESMPPTTSQDVTLHDYDVNYQDLLSVQTFSAQDVDTVGRKRKMKHIPLNEEDHMNETITAQRSPKFFPKTAGNIPGSSSGQQMECNNEANTIDDRTAPKHWTDIIFKVSEATKQLFSPYKLILHEIGVLEDLLGELQKARKYEMLCTSLRNGERFGDPHQKRVAEARSLQDKLVFEQAKLQLKHMKLDLLRNKAKLSQSRIRECNKLKSTFSQLCCRRTTTQTHEIHLRCNSTMSDSRNQEERNKVVSMRQELELLNQKVEHWVKSFKTACNIKGNMNCDGVIKEVNEHLEMRSRCRVIRQDLQLWELSDIVKKNNQSEIVLNYRNLLFQRFTISSGQVSSVIVNNMLNDTNIEKNFPNMNACMAFEFVFKAKDLRRPSNSKCFQQETLVTNLLLGTLLDMLEEVRSSKIQLWNLIFSSFHSQCSDQLELQLCFLNLRSGRKVTLALDVTDLGCATYPSNPSELQFRMISGAAQTTLPPSVFDEITSAVKGLQAGRPMMLRLCQRISQVVQASS